jgi:RND family efflux transporter MFP subunit
MPDTTQLEATDKPKLAEAGDRSTQAQVAEQPKQPEVSDKSKPGEQTGETASADANGKDSKKKFLKILAYVVIGLVALVLLKYFFFTPPEVGIVQVGQRDYVGEVQSTGTVNVDVLAAIGAKIPGRIEHMLVNEGDFVHSGQVVATLEDTDIRQVLDRSEARLQEARMTEQAARATEQAARAGARSAQALAESRGATRYQTERAWEREKHLVATGAVSQEEADQYEERDRTAASAVQAAEAEIGAAEAQIEAAGAKTQAAHSDIAAADAEVRLQQFNLSQTKIFTYVNGVVTDRPKRAGDAIVPGETVLTVADPKVTLVEAYLDQHFAGDIKAGQPATVILRGRANRQIAGRVYRVRPQADPAAEEMTVEIAFPLPPAELQIGQWADAYVQVTKQTNVLVVPKSAVTTMGDGRYVLVMDTNKKARRVDVQTLASSPRSQVMAVSGDLHSGDWVLTQPMGIKPGKKIRPIQNKSATGSTASNPAMKM